MNLRDLRMLYLDCQTTGVVAASSHILEIAWVAAARGELTDDLPAPFATTVELPTGVPLTRNISRVTGITEDDLADAQSEEEIFAKLKALVDDEINPIAACVIHFARFETPYINRLWNKFAGEDFPLPVLCTHIIARKLFPDFAHKGIRALAGYFGAPLDEGKRAGSHVEATMLIWQGLVDALADRGITTLEQLQEWVAEKVKVTPQKKQYRLASAKAWDLPNQPGVYRFLGKTGKVLYVGKATSLKTRVSSYFRRSRGGDSRKGEMLMQVYDVQASPVGSPLEAALLEFEEIRRLEPPYNIMYRGQPRQAVFYAKDFSSMATERDDNHCQGPILYPQGLTELLALGILDKVPEIIPEIFYEDVEPQVVRDGMEWICAKNQWSPAIFQNPRELLVYGAMLFRAHQQAALAADEEAAEIVADVENNDDDDLEEDEIEFVWTPEEVGAKIERMLMRSARVWYQGRWLARLSEAQIMFGTTINRKKTWRKVEVTGGEIRSIEACDADCVAPVPARWNRPFSERQSAMSVANFERLQLLLQELKRCANKGADVQIRLGPNLWLGIDQLKTM